MTTDNGIEIGLNAVVIAVTNEEPRLLTIELNKRPPLLPFGPFDPTKHRTLEEGLRSWVTEQTDLDLGYVEQLYTFGDRGRDPSELEGGPRVISVGYLALTSEATLVGAKNARWHNCYRYLPWEDWRDGEPQILDKHIRPQLKQRLMDLGKDLNANELKRRATLSFGLDSSRWNEELVLERYELLYEFGLVEEATLLKGSTKNDQSFGQSMGLDHRRIAATALGRLRGKIKYRPIIFELMQQRFTLLQLQRSVEALAGKRLHKQNFRRLIEDGGLVEETGGFDTQTGGRPAKQFQFRREVLLERLAPGVKIPGNRQTS